LYKKEEIKDKCEIERERKKLSGPEGTPCLLKKKKI